jgi:hypothetical protein
MSSTLHHLVGDGVADRRRLAGRVGFHLCHRAGFCAGNERVTFIAGDADGIGAAFKVHFSVRFRRLMAAGSRAQTEAIVATTISDNDGKRTIERIKFSGC